MSARLEGEPQRIALSPTAIYGNPSPNWGYPRNYCPTGSWVSSAKALVEIGHPKDNTGINVIYLTCTNDTGGNFGEITSGDSGWGFVPVFSSCPQDGPNPMYISGLRLWVMAYTKNKDDIGVHTMQAICRDKNYPVSPVRTQ